MGKRKFRLPGEEDLNKDQDRVLALPEDGQHLIVGGPGTGKSVVALLRALKYQDNNDYVFLVYNHVLEKSTCMLVDTRLRGTTLPKFIYKMHWHFFKEYMPELEKYKPDYNTLINKIDELGCEERTQHLIIDEGQDMPPKYYQALQYAGYINFFIVADQNQQITDDNSNRQELTDNLGLAPKDVIELKINYRNSHPIAFFASHFYTDKGSPPPDLPNRASLDTPSLYTRLTDKNIATMILREADKDDRKLIGVVVANEVMRDSYVNSMRNLELSLDNSPPVVSTYSSKEKKSVSIDFSQGGIVILNDKSIKGLEFDIVYIILDGFKIYNNDQTSMKKRLYVMSSRAIEKLSLVSAQDNSSVLSLLPTDEKVMKTVVGFEAQTKPETNDVDTTIPF